MKNTKEIFISSAAVLCSTKVVPFNVLFRKFFGYFLLCGCEKKPAHDKTIFLELFVFPPLPHLRLSKMTTAANAISYQHTQLRCSHAVHKRQDTAENGAEVAFAGMDGSVFCCYEADPENAGKRVLFRFAGMFIVNEMRSQQCGFQHAGLSDDGSRRTSFLLREEFTSHR